MCQLSNIAVKRLTSKILILCLTSVKFIFNISLVFLYSLNKKYHKNVAKREYPTVVSRGKIKTNEPLNL